MVRRKKPSRNARPQTWSPVTGADPGRGRAKRSDDSGTGVTSVDEDLLPGWTSGFVVLVTWAFRVYYVMSPDSWWVLHPDEIFQTMEVAHTELYGYGVRPYEFLGPPKGDNMSLLELKEKELGMWAMRSPLVPQYFMMISTVATALGFEPNPYLLWRVAHVSVTSWLPFAICTYVTSVTKSCDAGNIAAILTSISSHLTMFGTHTLVNSFVSPFLFLSLTHVTQLFRETRADQQERSSLRVDVAPSDPIVSKLKWNVNHTLVAAHYTRSERHTSKLSDHGYCTGLDDIGISDNDSTLSCDSNNSDESRVFHSDALTQQHKYNNTSKYVKANNLTDGPHDRYTSRMIQRISQDLTSVLTGLVMVLSIYVRPDASLPVFLLILTHLKFRTVPTLVLKKPFWCHFMGAMIAVAIAVGDDFYFYGCLVLTPVNWVKFNLFSGHTSQLFGASGKYFYFEQIFLKDFGMFVLTLVFTFAVITLAISDNRRVIKLTGFITTSNLFMSVNKKLNEFPGVRGHMTAIVLLIGIYSFVGHKESRFLHDAIVIFLGVLSMIIIAAIHSVTCSRHHKRLILLVLGSLFLVNQWANLREPEKRHPVAGPHLSSDDGPYINQCLHYISTQKDVRGVYLERSLLEHGSFTLLHSNVPVLFLHDRQYIEFDRSSLISDSRYCWLNTNCTSDYYAMFSVSDLIHESNQFILKRIVESKHYNYAIIVSGKEFFQPLYTKVFTTTNFSVWKRNNDTDEEEKMAKSSSYIPYGGENLTLVEYEGEVLKLHRSHHVALQRFQAAMSRGRNHASVYASMAFCLHRMGRVAEWSRVISLCKQKYSEGECMDGARVRASAWMGYV